MRKKQNKSGSVSVQIIDKSNGYRVYKTVGSSKNPEKINELVALSWDIIASSGGWQAQLFTLKTKTELSIENFVAGLANAQVHTIGPELIFGVLFDRIGFGKREDELFRHSMMICLIRRLSLTIQV